MIGKKIINSTPSSSKEYRIFNLAEYVRSPHNTNANEKCTMSGGLGFISTDPVAQAAEMAALANAAVKSKDPINHYVLSWRENESPSENQVKEAVAIFMDMLGVVDHQVIYGLHEDTDNIHLHLVLNRVHPETEKVVKIAKGFDIEALHKAVAVIEYAQGWQKETGARYSIVKNEQGKLSLKSLKDTDPDASKTISGKVKDEENRRGEKSAQTIAIERAWPLIKNARSWLDLHAQLADAGMRYEKQGSGAVLFVGPTPVKASSIAKQASLGNLVKRFGAFENAPDDLKVREIESFEAVDSKIPGVNEYVSITKQISKKRQEEKDKLFEDQKDQFKRLVQMQKDERERELSAKSWKGRGSELNALRRQLALKHKQELDSLKKRQKEQRDAFKSSRGSMPPRCEEWLKSRYSADVAHEYRFRHLVIGFVIADSAVDYASMQQHSAFDFELHGQSVYYKLKTRQGEPGADLIDHGSEMKFCRLDEGVVLAGLQMSAEKWGSFRVFGSPAFVDLAVRLAGEHGLQITNPELQSKLANLKVDGKADELERRLGAADRLGGPQI